MFLLDTNIVSEGRKLGSPKMDPRVAQWFGQIEVDTTFVSAMTIFELERGVQHLERRDAVQGAVLRRWLNDRVMTIYEHRTLSLSRAVALTCAGLHIPDPKSERDAWIAATAIDAGLILVSRNVADFAHMAVQLFNPFEHVPR
jgi:toxin FitB